MQPFKTILCLSLVWMVGLATIPSTFFPVSARPAFGSDPPLTMPSVENEAAVDQDRSKEAQVTKGATGSPGVEKKKSTPPVDPNRRWIMKQRDQTLNAKKIKTTRKPIQWATKSQQARCEEYSRELSKRFDKARYYSIQGDSCKTAGYAREFLELSGTCRSNCPKDFLLREGYNAQIFRNMQQLDVLGTTRCGTRKDGEHREHERSSEKIHRAATPHEESSDD